jgi:hypothetical protein
MFAHIRRDKRASRYNFQPLILREFQGSPRQAAGYSASLLPLGNFHIQQIYGPRLQAVIEARKVPINDYFEAAGVLVVFNFEIRHGTLPWAGQSAFVLLKRTCGSTLRPNGSEFRKCHGPRRSSEAILRKPAARAIIQTRLNRQQLVDVPFTVRKAVLVDAYLVQQSQMQVGQRSRFGVLDVTPGLMLSCSATH